MTSLTHTATPTLITDRSWLTVLAKTDGSVTQALSRVTLALVLLPHGAQHLLGWFGGYGFSASVDFMNSGLGIPVPLAAAGILLEFFGPLALIAGVASRLIGASLGVFMAVAAATHLSNGFFMNWFGTMPAGTEGFEYHLLAIALAAAITIRGAGAFSIDQRLTARG
jgi:putative oxidoreductase